MSTVIIIALNFIFLSSLFAEEEPAIDFKKLNILSKFTNKNSADNLIYSLNKSGQKVRLISQQIDIPLKSLSIGLFQTRMLAERAVKHLKENNIDAFVFELNNDKFRVHAGAMQDENNFWQRYEKLLALGYKKPHTTIKVVQATQYYVVSDKKEDTPLHVKIKSVTTKAKNTELTTEFLGARFKGEFSIWGDQGKRSSSNYFNAALSLRTKYKSDLDFTFGTRFDATEQSSEKNVQKFEFQWQPTYLRYHQPRQQWMIGAIDAQWDTINPNAQHESLSDRLSSKVLVRYKLDYELADKRRPVFGLRWKYNSEQYDLDVIWEPAFRPAKLPDFGSIWHPVRRSDGAIRGIEPTGTWKELVEKGSFANETLDTGGIGVRIGRRIGSRTRATTLQYARQNEPYYALNAGVQKHLSNGQTTDVALSAIGYTFTPEHPYTGVLTWEESSPISHFEIAVLSNTPYTTRDYEYKTAMSIAWKLGFIYPKKDRNTHISAYLIGRHINTNDNILDRKTKTSLFGELYQTSKNGLWKLGSSYEIGLDRAELFLNPRLTLQQSKYVQIYLNYLLFTGSENTESGYHTGHSILSLTWQAAF
ncbi:MAG: hypothetical protein OEM38_10245 [Gammaproteobacteria bacterium]|nr:hypothetical protein [Gammaproteobacteria bacterium]